MSKLRACAGIGCVALVACVQPPPASTSGEPPPRDGDSSALSTAPRWPEDVRWSVGAPHEGGRVGDYDGDGRLDLVLRGHGADVAFLAHGLGNGSFAEPVLTRQDPLRVTGDSFAQGDVDGDGRPDLAYLSALTSNDEPRRSRITVVSHGEGQARVSELEGAAGCLVLGDFTGDAALDAMAVYGGANSEPERVTYVRLVRGRGDGTFASNVPAARFAGFDTALCEQADFDGDGRPELLLAGEDASGGVLAVLDVDGHGHTVGVGARVALPAGPEDLSVGDVDGSGRPDVVLSRVAQGALDVVRFGAHGAHGQLEASLTSLALADDDYSFASDVRLADVDADGNLDLVLAGSDTRDAMPSGFLYGPVLAVLFGRGDGQFARQVVYQLSAGGEEFGEHVLVGDFDGDGHDDLALTTYGQGQEHQRIGVLLGPRE